MDVCRINYFISSLMVVSFQVAHSLVLNCDQLSHQNGSDIYAMGQVSQSTLVRLWCAVGTSTDLGAASESS